MPETEPRGRRLFRPYRSGATRGSMPQIVICVWLCLFAGAPLCAQPGAAPPIPTSTTARGTAGAAPTLQRTNDPPPTPTRKITFSGFLQGWLGKASGTRIGSDAPGSPFYEGRNYGMPASAGARLRYAEIAADGSLDARWYFHGMLDLARGLDGSSNRQVLEDLYAGYRISSEFALEVGRQRTGLGIEGSTDDNRLLTIARSIMNEDLPVRVGRLGDMRSTGAMLHYNGSSIASFVGIWYNPASSALQLNTQNPLFADAQISYKGVPRLVVSAFGGTGVFAGPAGGVMDRVGSSIQWQRGPQLFQGEIEFARDYSAPGGPGRFDGSSPRGGYLMYGYRLNKRLQAILRYDNFDEAQQKFGNAPALTETGILIPHANHKLREYTLGLNYYLDANQKLQINFIREDTEDSGAVYWGPQRSIVLAAYQIGLNSPTSPAPLRGADDSASRISGGASNALVIGPIFAPQLGYSAGIDISMPHLRLLNALSTRGVIGVLGNAHAPSVFGFPGTTYLGAFDEMTGMMHIGRGRSRFGIYGGVGAGGYFQERLYPGARLILGTDAVRTVGLELVTNITGLGRPYLSVETRIPL